MKQIGSFLREVNASWTPLRGAEIVRVQERRTVTGPSGRQRGPESDVSGAVAKNAQKQRGTRAVTEDERIMKSAPCKCGALHR